MELGKVLPGCMIIEIHADGRRVIGKVEYSGSNTDGPGIGWRENDGGCRDTVFSPASWALTELANVVLLLSRTAADARDCDVPPRTTTFYIIIL